MGCFNVACSISSLSISHGTRVALIPLAPKKTYQSKEHTIQPGSLLIYPNVYFNPLTLPIFGDYDDYGGIENIVRDDNTRAIEEYFDLPIEDFATIVTDNRSGGVNDRMSELYQHYAVNRDILDDIDLTAEALLALGFQLMDGTTDEYGKHPHVDCIVTLCHDPKEPNRQEYTITDNRTQKTQCRSGYRLMANFLDHVNNLFGYQLNVAHNQQDVVKELSGISAMFVHREIFAELAKDMQHQQPMTHKYDALRQQYDVYEAKRNALDITSEDYATELYYLNIMENPFFPASPPYDSLLSFFKDWPLFKRLYKQPIVDGSLRLHLAEYGSFYMNMYSMNRFFFPAMNGEQHGDLEASRRLYQKSLNIVERELTQIDR